MHSATLTLGVLITGGLLLSTAALSVYVSRVYLPMKIRHAYRKSITALAAAVETKDAGTVGHAQRVAQLTVEVARRLGIAGQGLRRIEYAALLMDMGKANVPQRVLSKRDPLTPEEWEIVKSHSRLGADMAGAVPFLADTADCILHHHEYWNGTGYPDALKGEQIPMESRILAVASDYDAMISDRPYHAPMQPDEAVAEIRKGIGVKYDPSVAEAFLELLAAEEVKG